MFRRPTIVFLVLSLVVAACSPSESAESTSTVQTTTTSSTTTTLPPTTTTVPFTVTDAPAELNAVVEGFYRYATGESTTAPSAPDAVLATLTPTPGVYPKTGTASLGTFLEQQVAVVETGDDMFLAVDDGAGWRIVGGQWPSLSVPAYFGAGPRVVAVVGSDARPGETVVKTRADSIHFVALDGAGGGAVVGVPRDSWVPIPGLGTSKINSSLANGGTETMMATFNELTGITMEGYLLTGFAGFEELLGSVLGGVEVEVPFAINDRWAHVALEAGEQILNGAQALGFARARKTVGGDLVRSEHQGVILLGAAKMVQAMGYSAIPGLMTAAAPYLWTNLTPEQLLTFSAMAISADLDAVPNVVAPGRPGMAGAASVVFLDDSVTALWDDLADGTLEAG